jgi:hypothetical protein
MSETSKELPRPTFGLRRFRAEHGRGGVVEMSDGSHWQVHPDHEIYTTHWNRDAAITVVPGSYPDFPYDLINAETGERVPARYQGPPKASTGWQLIDH